MKIHTFSSPSTNLLAIQQNKQKSYSCMTLYPKKEPLCKGKAKQVVSQVSNDTKVTWKGLKYSP